MEADVDACRVVAEVQRDGAECCRLQRCLDQTKHVLAATEWQHCQQLYQSLDRQQCHSHCLATRWNSVDVPSDGTCTHLDQAPADTSQTPAQLYTLNKTTQFQVLIWARAATETEWQFNPSSQGSGLVKSLTRCSQPTKGCYGQVSIQTANRRQMGKTISVCNQPLPTKKWSMLTSTDQTEFRLWRQPYYSYISFLQNFLRHLCILPLLTNSTK